MAAPQGPLLPRLVGVGVDRYPLLYRMGSLGQVHEEAHLLFALDVH